MAEYIHGMKVSDDPLRERTPEEKYVSLKSVFETRLYRSRVHKEEYSWQGAPKDLADAYYAMPESERKKHTEKFEKLRILLCGKMSEEEIANQTPEQAFVSIASSIDHELTEFDDYTIKKQEGVMDGSLDGLRTKLNEAFDRLPHKKRPTHEGRFNSLIKDIVAYERLVEQSTVVNPYKE